MVEAGRAMPSSRVSMEVAQETDAARREAAMRAYQRGVELYQQGTAESLRQALEQWQEALVLFQQIRDRTGEVVTLTNIGGIYNLLGERQLALNYFKQALPIIRALEDKENEAVILVYISEVYLFLGENQLALDAVQQALPLSQDVGNLAVEALAINNRGAVYSNLGEKQKALDYYNQALPLFQAVGDRAGEATTLNNIGSVYSDLGEQQRALDYYNQALLLRRAVGDRAGEATTLNNIGSVYSDWGEKQKALSYYSQSLPMRQAMGDRAGEATTLNNIGSVYSDLGEKQKALDYYNQALPLSQAVGDRAGEATTLNNIGAVYSSLGEQQRALDYYNQALLLRRAVGDRAGEATTLNNISTVYNALGEKQKALDYLDQALLLHQAVNDRSGEAVTIGNIGAVYRDLGEQQLTFNYYRQAFDYYKQALSLFRALGSHAGEANILNNIGIISRDLGEKQLAIDYFNQALPIHRAVGNRAGEATTLNNIGLVYHDLGEKQQALNYFNQALPILQAVGDRAMEATTLYNRAFLQRDQNQLQAALTDIEAALEIIEDLRGEITNTDLRQTYFAQVQNQGYYQFYADLLMQLHQQNPTEGYDATAFHVSERSRARTLIELLTEANVDFRENLDNPAAIELINREQSLYNQLRAQETILGQRLQNAETTEAEAEAKQAYLDTVRQLEDELSDIESQLKRLNPAYAELQYPEPLTLAQVQQQVLDDETVLLQYFLTENQSYLWLVTADGYKTYTLPSQAEINEAVTAFRASITDSKCVVAPNRDTCIATEIQDPGQILYDLILSPVADEIAGKRLLIVGDGALQYTPFAALPLPNIANYQPLLSQHEIVAAPSSTTIATQRQRLQARPPAPKALAVLADPVYSATDARVTGEAPPTPDDDSDNLVNSDSLFPTETRSLCMPDATVKRLPGTRQEADAIKQYFPASGVIAAMDFQANQAWFDQAQLDQYQHLFLATHGCLDTENPEFTGLVLSLVDEQGQQQKDGYLRLGEIFTLKLAADLVVLSACETGLGDTIKGEGMVGMTRGFMYAGAERVVVSLWNVNDSATAELMSQFYDLMHRPDNPLTAAAALREAQLQLWEQYQDPRLWAAFTLQGEWQ